MVFSKHTSYTINTPNYSSRKGRAITGWIVHHNASTNGEYVLALMHTGSKQVSANYQIMSNGDAVGVVDESLSSWSVSNQNWDGASITFETENSTGGPSWGISDASRNKIALIIADSATRYGIPINSNTVRGHNQGSGTGGGGSYATACPGPSMDVAKIIQLAQGYQLSGGGTTPIPNEEETEETMAFTVSIQEGKDGALGRDFLFDGDILTHIINSDVLKANTYVGIKNYPIDKNGFRQLVEARGFDYTTVNALPGGQAINRQTGSSVHAGDRMWWGDGYKD